MDLGILNTIIALVVVLLVLSLLVQSIQTLLKKIWEDYCDAANFIIIARGRRYFSNDAIVSALRDHATPVAELKLGVVPSAKVYELDQNSTVQFHAKTQSSREGGKKFSCSFCDLRELCVFA